jgi:hypothetical protein
LSGHDSNPWTYDAFSRRFGDRYRTLRVGEELLITGAARAPGRRYDAMICDAQLWW